MAPPCSVLIIALLVINSSVFSTSDFIYVDQESDNETFVYGDCEPANKNCTDCYLTLKKSLLRRDRNIRNLSVAFFPPKDNIPEFVAVTYCFDDHCTEKKRWFWTHDSSYLFFPIETFQYLSLFFGKPAAFFSREVQLRLDEECQNASIDMFTLLTQRVSSPFID